MKNYLQVLKIVSLAVVLSLGISFAYAWVEPLGIPPEDNVDAPLNISGMGQVKQGGLLVGFSEALDNINPSTGLSYSGLLVPHGNVGIGTTAPVSKLEVAGGIKIGNQALCDATTKGSIRFTEDKVQLCNGKIWKTFSEEPVEGTMTTFEGLLVAPVDIAFDGSRMWVVGSTVDAEGNVRGRLARVSSIGDIVSFSEISNWEPRAVISDGERVYVGAGPFSVTPQIEFSLNGDTLKKYSGGFVVALEAYSEAVFGIGRAPRGSEGVFIFGEDNELFSSAIEFYDFALTTPDANARVNVVGVIGEASRGKEVLYLVGDNVATDSFPSVTTSIDLLGPRAIAYDGSSFWVVLASGKVVKVPLVGKGKKSLGSPVTYPGQTGLSPVDIVFDGTNMWTANSGDNSVTKITPTGEMTTYVGTGAKPVAIAFDGQSHVWTANQDGRSVTRIQSR